MKKGDVKYGPGDGKLIDTWPFVYDALVNRPDWKGEDDEQSEPALAGEARVSIQVFMSKQMRLAATPPHPPDEVSFVLCCKNKSPELDVRMTGTDIESLRKAMFARLSDQFKIKFEQYFLVRVNNESVWRGTGSALSFTYQDVEKGTCWDGSLVMRAWEHRAWKISIWPGDFKDNAGKVLALIPATAENRTSLEEFAKRVDDMRKAMSETLRPNVILQTLAWMTENKGVPLLTQ